MATILTSNSDGDKVAIVEKWLPYPHLSRLKNYISGAEMLVKKQPSHDVIGPETTARELVLSRSVEIETQFSTYRVKAYPIDSVQPLGKLMHKYLDHINEQLRLDLDSVSIMEMTSNSDITWILGEFEPVKNYLLLFAGEGMSTQIDSFENQRKSSLERILQSPGDLTYIVSSPDLFFDVTVDMKAPSSGSKNYLLCFYRAEELAGNPEPGSAKSRSSSGALPSLNTIEI